VKTLLFLIAGLLLGTSSVVQAACTVEGVAEEIQFKQIQRGAELAKQANVTLLTLEKTSSHAKDPDINQLINIPTLSGISERRFLEE
jgi:hypothetical protein